MEVRAPEIVDPDELQSGEPDRLVPQHRDSGLAGDGRNPVGDIGTVPAYGVVVVPQDSDSPEPAFRKMGQHRSQLVKLARDAIRNPVPGAHHKIRSQVAEPPE